MALQEAMVTGLFSPDGSGPALGGILQNKTRAQSQSNFLDNEDTYQMYLYRLLDLAMSVFEWKNLPEGVDQRMLEFWLIQNGFCVFFKDDSLKSTMPNVAPEGYAVLQAMINGQWDLYNYPEQRKAYAVNGYSCDLDETNSVLIFNNYLRIPMFTTLSLYARRLAELDRTIDVNVMAQKTPRIIRCDEKQRLTMQNLMMQVQGNVYWVMSDKNVDLKNVEVLDNASPYVAKDLNVLKHQYWNEALTFLGIENVNTEKKERLVSDEVMSNMGDVEAQRFTRLNARKQACDKINDLFGLDVDVDFRSGIYIKADGFGSKNIPSTGMKDSSIIGEPGTGYDEDSSNQGIIGRIKSILGM